MAQSASWGNAQQCRPGEETDKGSVSINWKTNCAPGWGSGQSKKNWTKCKNCWKSVWYDRSTNHLVPSSNIAGWGQQRAFSRATAMLVALRNRGQEFREGSSQFPRKRHVQTSIQSLFSCLNFEQYPSWYKCLKWQSYNIILAFTFDVHWQRRGCWNSNLICLYKKVPFLFSESKLLLHFHECHYIVALLHITLIQDTDKWLEFYKSGLSLSPQWRHHCGVDCGGSMPLWCGGSMPAASCMFDRSQVTVTKLRSALFCPMFLFEWSSISMSYSIFIFTPL